ncbi:MAG TPA: histidine kinase dimerization/phospho-acceptor domain-containing protein [Labilithrix sp.]
MPDSSLLHCAVHDLRNPIAVLRATLEWLGAEVASSGEPADAVRDALSAADRLADVAEDLDLLARLGRGETVPTQRLVLVPIVTSALAAAAPLLRARDASITTAIDEAIAVTADRALLTRAVREIVTLTLKGVRSKTAVIVAAAVGGGEVAITVRADVPAEPPDLAFDGLGIRVANAIARTLGGSFEATARHAWKLCVPAG